VEESKQGQGSKVRGLRSEVEMEVEMEMEQRKSIIMKVSNLHEEKYRVKLGH
jgi:hypothetical protein